MENITLYEKVVALMQERGISFYKLEQKCHLGNGTVRGWNKHSPQQHTLEVVADFFGVSIDYFKD